MNEQIDSGELTLPDGVSVSFAGTYENQVRAAATLRIVIPVSLLLIFLVLHLHFRSVSTTAVLSPLLLTTRPIRTLREPRAVVLVVICRPISLR